MENTNLFAAATSLFSVVKNADISNIDLNNNLKKIGEWAFLWKINFNPDPTEQAQKLIFFRKVKLLITLPYFSIKISLRKPSFKNI